MRLPDARAHEIVHRIVRKCGGRHDGEFHADFASRPCLAAWLQPRLVPQALELAGSAGLFGAALRSTIDWAVLYWPQHPPIEDAPIRLDQHGKAILAALAEILTAFHDQECGVLDNARSLVNRYRSNLP